MSTTKIICTIVLIIYVIGVVVWSIWESKRRNFRFDLPFTTVAVFAVPFFVIVIGIDKYLLDIGIKKGIEADEDLKWLKIRTELLKFESKQMKERRQ